MAPRRTVTPTCTCSYCKHVGHTRRNCPERDKAVEARGFESGECPECADLPWRRDQPHCLSCKGYYAPEAPLTIDEFMNRPAEDRRIEP